MAKLYWAGDVGYYNPDTKEGITVAKIKADLDASAGQPIEVELTTFGGDYFQAAPALNLLQSYPGQKTVYLNGIVASAGTVIAMGFDKVIARPTSMFMIHNAQGMEWGDHNKMRETADRQEKMSNMVAELYAKKTGKKLEEVKAWMDGQGDGTWFMGQEIVDAGFADEMEDTKDKPTSMMLLSAQAQYRDRVTMWSKAPSVQRQVESLIESGAFDKSAPIPADADLSINEYPIAKNGKVYRSSLRSISARAAKDKPELAEWAVAMIAKIDAKGVAVNRKEVLDYLSENPIPLADLAAAVGQVNMIASKEQVELSARLKELGVADPVAEITTLRADLKAVETDRRDNLMQETFGVAKLENGQVNMSRDFAEVYLKDVPMAELKAKIEDVKKNPTFLKLRGELFDVNSEQNAFRVEGDKPNKDKGAEKHLKL